jgi:tetratricopeptide (TPR) repeat protein
MQQGSQFYEVENFQAAAQSWQTALSLISQDDRLNRVIILSYLSLAHQQLGDWQAAEKTSQDAIALLQAVGAQSTPTYLAAQAKALNAQGRLYWSRGEFEPARLSWQQAADFYKQIPDPIGVAMASINQAVALQDQGRLIQAKTKLYAICEGFTDAPQPAQSYRHHLHSRSPC